jgi:hypothetical protein
MGVDGLWRVRIPALSGSDPLFKICLAAPGTRSGDSIIQQIDDILFRAQL